MIISNVMTLEQKKYALAQLNERYKQCQACPLANFGRTNVVFGNGNPDASLMMIGEAPGEHEDKQSKPFVGKAGRFLIDVLTQCNIDPTDLFMTNVVKCRPPNNRNPKPLEIKTCTKLLLEQQIAIVQPQVICTLGIIALQALTGIKKQSMRLLRGKPITIGNLIIVPTFHPAYVNRTRSKLPLFKEDLIFSQNIRL